MSHISIVVPDGSMQKVVSNLFDKAGLPITIPRERTKAGYVENAEWISCVTFQRPQEIPHYLKNGHFDVAIVGEDWIANWGYDFPTRLTFPIGRSGSKPVRIILAVPEEGAINCIEDLPQNAEIATEYVNLVKRFLARSGREDITVIPSYGNTEHKIGFGATAIVDVTESGTSLRENGLKIIYEIMTSNTVIVVNPESLLEKSKALAINCFVQLMNGAFQASQYVILVANVPENVCDTAATLIGGLKGPSCSPIRGVQGWFALQSIIPREREQKIIFDLLEIGVTDIVVNRDIPLIMS